jgi:hypothetical protein
MITEQTGQHYRSAHELIVIIVLAAAGRPGPQRQPGPGPSLEVGPGSAHQVRGPESRTRGSIRRPAFGCQLQNGAGPRLARRSALGVRSGDQSAVAARHYTGFET